jgi:4'-phosphopantetheinyl transferase
MLTLDEKERASRFRFNKDRRRFIVARGFLRNLCGHYLNKGPVAVNLRYGEYGKPELDVRDPEKVVYFNLSHAGDYIVYGFCKNRKVGIDVEQIHEFQEMNQVAESFFSEDDVAIFKQFPMSEKADAFFSYWTRKEAYLKATGEGLSLDPKSVSVPFLPCQEAKILTSDGPEAREIPWTILSLKTPPRYAAAVAVEGIGIQLSAAKWLELVS